MARQVPSSARNEQVKLLNLITLFVSTVIPTYLSIATRSESQKFYRCTGVGCRMCGSESCVMSVPSSRFAQVRSLGTRGLALVDPLGIQLACAAKAKQSTRVAAERE
jgi:hypothetical protein